MCSHARLQIHVIVFFEAAVGNRSWDHPTSLDFEASDERIGRSGHASQTSVQRRKGSLSETLTFAPNVDDTAGQVYIFRTSDFMPTSAATDKWMF